jgi:hypothetical protein
MIQGAAANKGADRAGEGWFRFLDPSPLGTECRDLTGDYVARLGNFGIVVVDSAKVNDHGGVDSD